MKKLIAVLAIVLLAGAMVFASGGQQPSGTSTAAAQPAKVTVEIFDRGTDGGKSQPADNEWTKWIKEKVLKDLNIEVEFHAVSRWNESTDIVNLMASGSAPDLCYTYNAGMISNFTTQGGITNLAPYIDTLLPDAKKLLGADPAFPGQEFIYRHRDPATGDVYSIPSYITRTAEKNIFIRKDWLDKLGLPLPKTTEEFHNALIAFRDRDPGNVGKNNVIPFAQDSMIDHGVIPFVVPALDYTISDRDSWINSISRPFILVPGCKEALRMLNGWYNEGLILRDFPLFQNIDDFNNLLKTGVVGAFTSGWDTPWRGDFKIAEELARNVPGAEFVPVDCIPSSDGVTRKAINDKPGGIRIYVPGFSQNKEAALKYLNWLCIFENFNFIQTGTVGVNHEIVNGVPKAISLPANHPWIMNSANNIDYTMTINGVELLDPELTARVLAFGYANVSGDVITNAYNISCANGRPPVAYQAVTTKDGIYGQDLSDKSTALVAQVITARPEDFDRIWNDGIRDYLSSGAQEIIDERSSLWQE